MEHYALKKRIAMQTGYFLVRFFAIKLTITHLETSIFALKPVFAYIGIFLVLPSDVRRMLR